MPASYPIQPPIPSTSGVAPGIPVAGTQLQAGNGASPEIFTTICNVADLSLPLVAETADVTNVGCQWRSRIKTLLDMGKIKFKIFWVMEEATHENDISGAVRGLRYLFLNLILVDWKLIYNDFNYSTDYFQAYVTGFSETGKVGGVWEAEIELTNSVLGSVIPILQ